MPKKPTVAKVVRALTGLLSAAHNRTREEMLRAKTVREKTFWSGQRDALNTVAAWLETWQPEL